MRDEELLRRYLLGGLPADDKDRLESRLIQEPELFELAEAVEDEVLDDYAHGRLDPAERIRVERRLLASPQGQSRLAVIRGLGKIASEDRMGRVLPWRVRDLSTLQRYAAAIAAMLLIATGTVWITSQQADLPELAEKPVITQPAPAVTPVPPTPTIPPEQPTQLAERETPPMPTPTRAPLVLTLTAAVLRGEEGIEQLSVPVGTEEVELHIGLANGDAAYESYNAILIDTVDGTEVLQASDLKAREIGGDKFLVLQLDGKQLHGGIYSVEVYGVPAEGEGVLLVAREFGIQMPAK